MSLREDQHPRRDSHPTHLAIPLSFIYQHIVSRLPSSRLISVLSPYSTCTLVFVPNFSASQASPVFCPSFLSHNLGSPYFLFCFAFVFVLFCFVCFLLQHLQHMDVPGLGVESELQLPVTATATLDLSLVGNLHRSSWQCWILNPLSKARDGTHILEDTSWVHNPLGHKKKSGYF